MPVHTIHAKILTDAGCKNPVLYGKYLADYPPASFLPKYNMTQYNMRYNMWLSTKVFT